LAKRTAKTCADEKPNARGKPRRSEAEGTDPRQRGGVGLTN